MTRVGRVGRNDLSDLYETMNCLTALEIEHIVGARLVSTRGDSAL